MKRLLVTAALMTSLVGASFASEAIEIDNVKLQPQLFDKAAPSLAADNVLSPGVERTQLLWVDGAKLAQMPGVSSLPAYHFYYKDGSSVEVPIEQLVQTDYYLNNKKILLERSAEGKVNLKILLPQKECVISYRGKLICFHQYRPSGDSEL